MPLQVDEKGFVFDPDKKLWLPPLNVKQIEVFDDYHRYLLVHGPRKSGKTYGILHKVIRHAFDVQFAIVAIVCKTIKNAKSAGVWVLLERMLRIWAGTMVGPGGYCRPRCPGFTIVEGPKTTGDSKMSYVRIKNRYGGISEIQCHSLEHSAEVEAKFKGPAYSMFWLSEFDQYCDEHAWDIMCDALRAPDVPYEAHQIVADCNPPDTGTNNWIHDKFFKFVDEVPKEGEDAETAHLRSSTHRILVNLDDNPQLDPRERKDIEARYKKRKALFNRFILGRWEQDITDGHFSDVWDEATHVVGNADGMQEDWEIIVPTTGCTELLTGWDIGEKKSHSFHIVEKVTTEEETSKRLVVNFRVLDELVMVNKFVSVEEFTLQCLAKMEFWERYQKKENGIVIAWRHWSDTSAFEKRASANANDAAIVYATSKGKISLRGAPKYRDSNRDKVNLLWQFLFVKRLLVSSQCFRTRTMFAMLRSDPKSANSQYVRRDEHKHPFDSLSYPIMSEAPMDMMNSAEVDTDRLHAAPAPVFAGF